MKLLYNSNCLTHETGIHPEKSGRLSAFGALPEIRVSDASKYLSLVHRADYIEQIKEAHLHGNRLNQDTVVSEGSFMAAVTAVGVTLAASQSNDFALVRPPGHHAFSNRSSGFCLFNNVAIATERLVEAGKRVLIFDFDGHLGDGTSSIFYHTDQVLYWSMHQAGAFPYAGSISELGAQQGRGFTINTPLPPASGDDIFMDAFRSVLPIVKKYQPDVVAVSAGFDAHRHDPLLDLRVTCNSFYKIGKALAENFDNVFATLEGGYNVEWLVKGVHSFLAGINGVANPTAEAVTTSSRRTWEAYEMDLHSLLYSLREFYGV